MTALNIGYRCDAEIGAELLGGNQHGTGLGSLAGLGLREGGGTCGVEGDVTFDLLHGLVNVPVEHGDGAKWLEHGKRERGVVGAPAPLRINRPEWDVREHYDRCAF